MAPLRTCFTSRSPPGTWWANCPGCWTRPARPAPPSSTPVSPSPRTTATWWPILCCCSRQAPWWDGTEPAAIIQPLLSGPGDAVITNQQVGGFGTELAGLLESGGIGTLLLAGVATNISVESTARAAVDHGFRVVIVEDACSAVAEAA
nr:isochorismatase family cysteine hydrolase [Glutamicibacter nicotianae]